MLASKKILIVTPKFPYPATGACEQDRFWGIKDFLRYGFEVRVITKVFGKEKTNSVLKIEDELKIKIFSIQYKFGQLFTKKEKIKNFLFRFLHPLYLDGAALEYVEKEIQSAVRREIDDWHPDLVWFEYTYLWPLYGLAKKKGIPIATRSINFEPLHFLEEEGFNPLNFLKFPTKLISEFKVVRDSDVIFSITPKEEKIYKKLGARKVINLPLRGLPDCLNHNHLPKNKDNLDVFFLGSTFNVSHNRKALEFILKDIAVKTNGKFPDKFRFHILGAKFPFNLRRYLGKNIVYEGYVENLDGFLENMDIAVIPSSSGCGMQQKIFEPLSRGFPVITHKRGLAGYPFDDGKEILLAESADDFVSSLGKLLDYGFRKEIAAKAKEKSKFLFSREKIDDIILSNI